MPHSTEHGYGGRYGNRGRDSNDRGHRNGNPGTYTGSISSSDKRKSWRDSMERGSYQNGGYEDTLGRGSNGHARSEEAPTLPRRTLRGQPPPGARAINPQKTKKPGDPEARTWLAGLYISCTCCVLSLGLMAAAFGTSGWMHTSVDREAITVEAENDEKLSGLLTSSILYRNNHRGLFKTCYAAVDTSEGELCETEKGYELSRQRETARWGTDYELYIHLIRLVFVSILLALLFQLLTLMFALCGCVKKSRRMLLICITLGFFAFLFSCGGMGSFHGVDYYEMKKVHQEIFPAGWPDYHPELYRHYTRSFGYSYFLGWVGAALSFVAVLSFIVSYISLGRKKGRQQRRKSPAYANFPGVLAPSSQGTVSRHGGSDTRGSRGGGRRGGGPRGGGGGRIHDLRQDEADTYYTTSSAASRNFAYEMSEKNLPPPDELDCLDESIFSESTKL